MTKRVHEQGLTGVAVTLITSSKRADGERAARILTGRDHFSEPESTDAACEDDDADFAVALAERSASAAANGHGGNSVIVLAETADVVEIALVTEHVLETRHPALAVGIRDVIAVTSAHEVIEVLCPPVADAASAGAACDLDSCGRLASRIEFASIIVLSDIHDPGSQGTIEVVRDLLSRLAPRARILGLEELATRRTPDAILPRGLAHRLGACMGWQLELANDAPTHQADDAVGSFVFRDPRPFHPHRLHDAVLSKLTPARVGRIVRSRGFVQLATRPGLVGAWSTAGDVLDLDPTAMSTWDSDSPIGQEIAFFGIGLNAAALRRTLADCLVDDTELIAGPALWATFIDPFPEWPAHAD